MKHCPPRAARQLGDSRTTVSLSSAFGLLVSPVSDGEYARPVRSRNELHREWPGATQLRANLDALGVPDELRDQIDFSELAWPCLSGCGLPLGRGSARVVGDFRLTQWCDEAPGLIGDLDVVRAESLDAIADRLRCAGEGARVAWGMELWHDGWAGVDLPAFLLEGLYCVGPRLSEAVIADVDARFAAPVVAEFGWGRLDASGSGHRRTTNAPVEWGRTGCWSTYWSSLIN